MEKVFTLYWLSGLKETLKGTSFEDAFMRAGYINGARMGLDFYKEGEDNGEYKYFEKCGWVRKAK